ncbi:MAG: hypothetical protein A3C80_01785 [Candidatus Ryanbacteria bacterium RIFCSPHIGHO2_02_FULL_45_43]|uniref:Uncharacterized protein n=1 Tax=Candidatus Ryanbacteria bacterium RIFCSPHIGHO2_01_45_13 TaxID=1802112 RepID=A0A1G2FZ08_9BACT|nr:MAG: hypothetical protein A2718_02620 [Candidatus Ryanbacteria bacterium RIFCSPHIGHO2_01_FULL_44_130]OGZ42972.1 MAG: hypothetical protein A2W41_02560 [Candidatus Ryanbacteria bacterium RIFCSPHIGHO2_01_45_13]OGZ48677.1 MAG: hypothetical protein A3C80_01785 [Candidatus Ryanbacteria bacterium RIFCSPHIGHO2_02_FULL_45_43]OGZ50617.1 MAG: hypothetical protein A3E55_03265 [Candidatus Ryanbacteria bacterium RIFCSPHIGHO2_12_FULL_44_20]OGZ51923.1 MAG: hypothetical protein A3A17_00640 [Candidatus Ryanba
MGNSRREEVHDKQDRRKIMKKLLSEEKRKEIFAVIYEKMFNDDKDPIQVIEDSYHGDEDRYLLVMARRYNVQIDE